VIVDPARMTARDSEVIIVGAGLAGLVAARELMRAGVGVEVLEARDRVGGRTLSVTLDGQTVDLGGQWMGDRHARLRKLAEELGVGIFPQHARGIKRLLTRDGRLRTFSGFVPKIGLLGVLDLALALSRLERLARRVVLEDPLATPRAQELDAQTFADYLARRVRTPVARDLLGLATQMIFAAEPHELSLLYFLLYAHSGEGVQRLGEIEHGAQEQRFTTGAQALCDRLAAELAPRVRLGSPVQAIEQSGDEVVVHVTGGAAPRRARRAILAVPPALAKEIDLAGVSDARARLHAEMPMGSVIKCVLAYPRAFWREAGCSGEGFAITGSVRATFDDSSPTGDHAALVAFVVGDAAKQLSRASEPERRAQVIADVVRLHGPDAATPTAYVDRDWLAEPWSRGCYVGVMPPGLLSATAAALRAPCGRLHFAGTETAVHHVGYLEGAIESGERAAREVLALR